MATILIVDDRPSNRQFLTTLLAYGGHRLLEAADGAEALAQVQARRPDLVITDILMPNMDGYEFVQRLRADPATASTPVIFYTASYSTPQAEALAESCGVRQVLSKPSEPQVIVAAVNDALGATGAAAQPLPAAQAAAPQSVDDSMSLYAKDLHEVRARFEGLAARSEKPRAGRDSIQELSKRFAGNVAAMQRVTGRLSALVEVGMEMMAERDPARLVEVFFAAACDLIGSKYAAVGMLDERERALRVVFAKGFDARIVRGEDARTGLLGRILSGERVLQALGAAGRDEAEGLPSGHPPVRDLLGIPVASAGRVYGWMYFAESASGQGFSEEDTRVATVMTRKLALLYENALLYDEIQRHAAELQIEMSERRRAEEALQRFRFALDNSGDIILITDRATMLHIDANETACRLLGYTRDELLSMGPPDILPVSRAELEAVYDQLIADPSQSSGMSSYYRCKDGSRLPFESTRRLVRSGERWLIVAISRDIRGRIAVEQALRESEQGLRRAQLVAKLAHVISRPDGAFESWSETLPQLIGVDVEGLPKSTREWLNSVHPDDRQRFRERAIEAGATAGRFELEYRLRRADGAWIDVRQVSEPMPGDSGGPARWFGTLQDVTEERQAGKRLRASESLKSAILEASLDGIVTIDHEGKIVEFNPAAELTFGLARDQAIGEVMVDLIVPPRLRDAHRRGFAHYLATGEGRMLGKRLELAAVRADGTEFPIELAITSIRSGSTPMFTGFIRDITQRKEAEAKISRLNRVYAVLSGINTLILRVRDRDQLFREACRIAVKNGGFRMAWVGIVDPETKRVKPAASDGDVRDFFDSTPWTVAQPGAVKQGLAWRAMTEMRPMIANDIQSDPHTAMKKQCADRGINSLVMLPLLVGGEGIGVLALYAAEAGFFDDEEMKLLTELAGDISFALAHLRNAEKLNYLAYYDELTGLANRALLHERLTQQLTIAKQEKRRVALVLLDIERFKTINDTFGRQAGDALLCEVGERMRVRARDSNWLARISADHFAIVVPDVTTETELAHRTEERLHEIFDPPFRVADTDLRISAKLGIAVYPADGADADALLLNAEAALKKAKATGERYLFYREEMSARVGERLALETRLRGALEEEQFVLHYQPKVSLEDRKIVGVEALIRWRDPGRGLVPPVQFIPLLEETGMILQVGAWAMRRAVLDHRQWLEQGIKAPRVAVNVSQIQLRQADFVEVVTHAMAEGAKPTALDLEITESLLMEDVQVHIRKLAAIHAGGVNIAIDDFGTGYSSLSYLAKLPVQALKIDRSFIVTMLEDPAAMTLVQTIISLAHALRLKVIAEGVETEPQAKMLRLVRCDEMQGYLISKPLPMEEITPLLRTLASK